MATKRHRIVKQIKCHMKIQRDKHVFAVARHHMMQMTIGLKRKTVEKNATSRVTLKECKAD